MNITRHNIVTKTGGSLTNYQRNIIRGMLSHDLNHYETRRMSFYLIDMGEVLQRVQIFKSGVAGFKTIFFELKEKTK